MKIYTELSNNLILCNNTGVTFTNTPDEYGAFNFYYRQFLEEQAKGEAELIPFTPPRPTWEEIRIQRDNLLIQSDWAIIPDATPKPNKQAWLDYRQQLRDVPQNFLDPEDVVWPTKPQ